MSAAALTREIWRGSVNSLIRLILWLGIVIVTDLSLMRWLLGNFRSAEWPLILGDILALIAVSWGCYSLHTRIESAIAKLEEL